MSSIESKRVQYRKYLERAGVIDALSKALIKLYEEQNKPDDAIRFVRKFMCETCPDDSQYDAMKSDLEEAQKTIVKLETDLERLRAQIKKTPEEVAQLLEEGFKSLIEDEEKASSLLRKYLTKEILESYKGVFSSPPVESSFLDCIQSGLEYHDSKIGVYAGDPECYDLYPKIFEPIVRDYHEQWENDRDQMQPDPDFGNKDEIENLDPEKKYIQSTRIRLARNLEGYPFMPKITEKQYIEIETKAREAFEVFDGELAGAYFSLKDVTAETQREMVARHVLFKRTDKYQKAAGAHRFWPTGRGIFHNPAETFIVWVNEEDHLRIIAMANCGDLGDIYSRVIKGLQDLEKSLTFTRHPRYGYLTPCPTNVGTTIRASVHIRLPMLARDLERLSAVSNDLGLQIRGTDGELDSEFVDGVMDISNRKRCGFTEFEVLKSLQEGIVTLIKAEQELETKG